MVPQHQAFKTVTIIFTALLTGQVSFALIAYFLVTTGKFDSTAPELEKIFTLLVPVVMVAGWLGGKLLYDKKIQTASGNMVAAEKLEIYRAAVILRWAMLEGPVILGIISYLLTGKELLLLFAVVGIVLFDF